MSLGNVHRLLVEKEHKSFCDHELPMTLTIELDLHGVKLNQRAEYLGHRSLYLSILWAEVQPTLDLYAEAFYSRPIALTLGGEEFSVDDVCKCMRDCRVGWAE